MTNEKEKAAFGLWREMPYTDSEKRFANNLSEDNADIVRAFYGGYHSRDKEIARLLAEIERKDDLLRDVLNSGRVNEWQETDERIGYVDVQIDKSTLADIRKALQNKDGE